VPDILNQDRGRRGGGNQRGFGSSGDQILINGKRLSAKSSSVRDLLARTSASQVERVELIRGATDGLDVQSEGLVVNVVLIEGASTSSIFWKIAADYMVGKDTSPEFEVSYKGKTGKLDYTFALKGRKRHGYFFRDEELFDISGAKTGEKDLDGDYNFDRFDVSSNLTYSFENGDAINLNGNFIPTKIRNEQHHMETGDDVEILFWDTGEKFREWEVGGDYTTNLNYLGKLKVLFVKGGEKNIDYITNRYDGTGNEQYLYGRELVDFSSSEDVYRASLTRNLSERQSFEFGAETAFNRFHQKFDDFERDALGDPLVLSTSNNISIKENRYEIFAHHNFTISPKVVLQSSLTTEFSRIVADSILEDGSISREDDKFTFLKPRLNFRYDVTNRNQLRLLAEKKVSQLEFFHYMTFFDQDTKELKFGNTSIRPSQTWDFSATYEHRLAKDAGTLEMELFYRHFKDYIARVDFTEYEDLAGNSISSDAFFALPPSKALRDDIDFTSKSGNIDKASAIGLTLKSNTRLGFVGLPEAQLGLAYEFEKRRFIDPFTLTSRNFRFQSDHTFKINFRHDVTKWNLSYGFEANLTSGSEQTDIAYDWQWKPGREYELFVEYKILKDIKLRLEAEQQPGTNQRATFNRFQDHIRFAELKSRSEQLHDRPHEVSISLEGTF
tara:strand:+ start:222500 stop:224506 length:2007 start_codon:yes stop_codon:yes gene_type:complete